MGVCLAFSNDVINTRVTLRHNLFLSQYFMKTRCKLSNFKGERYNRSKSDKQFILATFFVPVDALFAGFLVNGHLNFFYEHVRPNNNPILPTERK